MQEGPAFISSVLDSSMAGTVDQELPSPQLVAFHRVTPGARPLLEASSAATAAQSAARAVSKATKAGEESTTPVHRNDFGGLWVRPKANADKLHVENQTCRLRGSFLKPGSLRALEEKTRKFVFRCLCLTLSPPCFIDSPELSKYS